MPSANLERQGGIQNFIPHKEGLFRLVRFFVLGCIQAWEMSEKAIIGFYSVKYDLSWGPLELGLRKDEIGIHSATSFVYLSRHWCVRVVAAWMKCREVQETNKPACLNIFVW